MGGKSSTPESVDQYPTRSMPNMMNLDNVLQYINSQCISLSKDIEQRNNKILSELVNTFVEGMKRESQLFATLYNRIFYGGSYYDGLKVGEPNEYDLDLLMRFPRGVRYHLSQCERPGFLRLEIENPEQLGEEFTRKLMQGTYLNADKLRRWMEGLVTKVLGTFPSEAGYYRLSAGGYLLRGKMRKSGPAMTLEVTNTYEKICLNVDLVPCFEFNMNVFPDALKPNPVPSKSTFFIVPKRPKDLDDISDLCWRLSFQEQERELIKGKRNLKPALKLLKRLRDVCCHDCIASYYIKTVFLLVDEGNDSTFWDGRLSDIFLKMLETYIRMLESGIINYFWNEHMNLLTISEITLANVANRLRCIHRDIQRNRDVNPRVVCRYLGVRLDD